MLILNSAELQIRQNGNKKTLRFKNPPFNPVFLSKSFKNFKKTPFFLHFVAFFLHISIKSRNIAKIF